MALQMKAIEKAFTNFMETYIKDHPKFEYKQSYYYGFFSKVFKFDVKFKQDSDGIVVINTIEVPIRTVFNTGNKTDIAIKRGLEKLTKGLNAFEDKVKEELILANAYNLNELVSTAYDEFKTGSTLK